MAFQVAVHNWGPGATPEEQAAAAAAQTSYPYMGFGTRQMRPKVFNWVDTPQQDYQKFGTLTPGKIQQQPQHDPALAAARAQQQAARAYAHQMVQQRRRAAQQDAPQQPLAPTTPTTPYTPSPVPEAPKFELPPLNLPQTPQFGGIGTNYGGGIGSNMQVNTGIQSGLLPQTAIDSAVGAAKAPAAAPIMPNVSGAQASALSQLFQDGLGQAQSQNAVDLSRSGSYEQAQMLNAMQKARASAGLDWANLGTRFQETSQSAQQPYRSFLWNLLGSIA